jgi:hypothetical protein
MNKEYPVTVTVPALFYSDHIARECGKSGVIVKENSRTYTVSLDESAWIDLYSDADYYASMKGNGDYAENKSLVDSAIRTLTRMNVGS